jgi:hypothetical protein
MTRKLLVLAAFAVAVALPASSASAAPSEFVPCAHASESAGWFNLEAKNTACRVARKVADHFIAIAGAEDDGYKGWHCANKQNPNNPLKNTCRRTKDGTHQRIRFEFAG